MRWLEDGLLESMAFGDMALRLLLAAVFGLVLGFEREA